MKRTYLRVLCPARERARRLARLFARRLGVKAPVVLFSFDRGMGGAAFVQPNGVGVVTVLRNNLHRRAWWTRAIVAHEVGHLRAQHTRRTLWLSWGVTYAVVFAISALPAPWWVGIPVGLALAFVAPKLVARALYFGYEVEADRWGVRAGGLAIWRLRRVAAALPGREGRWHQAVFNTSRKT